MARPRTCDLLDGPREPPPGAYGPEPEGVREDDPDGNRRVVERLGVDRGELREAEDDGYEGDPEHGGDGYWERELAEVEGTSCEPISVDDAQGDGQSCGRFIVGVK